MNSYLNNKPEYCQKKICIGQTTNPHVGNSMKTLIYFKLDQNIISVILISNINLLKNKFKTVLRLNL